MELLEQLLQGLFIALVVECLKYLATKQRKK